VKPNRKLWNRFLGKDGAGKVGHAEEPESENHPFAMGGKHDMDNGKMNQEHPARDQI
jgi:hypothetical protein